MTREEIIQAISDDKTMPFIQPEQLAGIVDFVIKNCKPSLPEGLEEAADQFVGYDMDTDDLRDYEIGIEAFKAGAKWDRAKMTEKAMEGEVIGYDDGTGKFITVLEDLPDDSPYKVHDKVKLIVIPEEK